jgi:hypothetical protein
MGCSSTAQWGLWYGDSKSHVGARHGVRRCTPYPEVGGTSKHVASNPVTININSTDYGDMYLLQVHVRYLVLRVV